jgi:hypothetical protein
MNLDLRLFAHILNDLDLNGSYLQGSRISDTASYFQRFISRIANKQLEFKEISKEKMASIANECKASKVLLDPFIELSSQCDQYIQPPNGKGRGDRDDYFQDLSKTVIDQISQHQRAFIPGGWIGTPGHAMLYEFKKQKNGELIFLVWNTGSGLNDHHLHEETSVGKRYSPVKAFLIPKVDAQKSNVLSDFVKKLLEPQIQSDKSKELNANVIYKDYISHIAFLNGQEIDPTPYCNEKIQGQWSGTCAWQVIAQIARNYGFDGLHFEEIHYEIIRATLIEFFQLQKATGFQDPAALHQLELGIKNYALFLRSLSERDRLEPARQQAGLSLINNLKAQLQIAHKAQPNVPVSSPKKITISDKFQVDCPTWAVLSCPKNAKVSLVAQGLYAEEIHQVPLDFQGILKLINKELSRKSVPEQLVEEILRIEQILLNLPLSEDFWKKLTKNELISFNKKLELLTEIYVDKCKKQDKFAFAERIIAANSATAVNEIITNVIFQNNVEVLKASKTEFVATVESFKNAIDRAFCLMTVPKADQRKNQIKSIFKKVGKTDLVNEFIITALANQNKSLCKEIQTEGFKYLSDVPENMVAGAYYFLNRTQYREEYKLKHGKYIEEKYSDLNNEIEFYFSSVNLRALSRLVSNDAIGNKKQHEIKSQNWQLLKLDKNSINDKYYYKYSTPNSSSSRNEGQTFTSDSIALGNDTLKEDLCEKRKSANEIQVKLRKLPLPESICTRRQLAHIRSKRSTQIASSIEYIKKHLTLLNDEKNIQKVLFTYLFQGGNIIDEITQKPKMIKQLIACLEEGVGFYQDKKTVQTKLFFLQSAVFLQSLVFQLQKTHPELKHLDQLAEKMHFISNEIKSCANKIENNNNKTQVENTTLTTLYALQILQLNSHRVLKGSLTEEEIQLFIKGNYALNQLSIEAIDPFLIKELNIAKLELKRFIHDQSFNEKMALEQLLKQAGLSLSPAKFQGKFPHYTQGTFLVNLLEGIIVDSGKTQQPLPQRLWKDDNFNELFSTHQKIVYNDLNKDANNRQYFFSVHNENYELIERTYNNSLIIRKQAMISIPALDEEGDLDSNYKKILGEENSESKSTEFTSSQKWYQLQKLSSGTLPDTMIDSSHHTWQSFDGSILIYDKKTNEKKYYYDSDSQRTYRLDNNEKPDAKLIKLDEPFQFLTEFEDSRFIELWQDLGNDKIEINLPRYDLTFISERKGENIEFIWQSNKNYKLVLNKHELFSGFGSCLRLEPINGDISKPIYITPKQTFLPSKNKEKEYYQCVQDINGSTKIAAHLHYKGEKPTPENMEKIASTPWLFEYHKQEQYLKIERNQKGELQTKSVASNLFLAYILLAKNAPENALALLKKAEGAFSGTREEIEALYNIILDTPSGIIDPKQAHEARLSGPEYTAVRLYACSILTKHLNKGKRLSVEEKPLDIKAKISQDAFLHQTNLLNGIVQKDKFINIVNQYVSDYLAMKDVMPKKMQLSTEQILPMITLLKANGRKDLYSSIYKKKKQFRLWQKEYHSLKKIEKDSELNKQQAKRIIILEERFKKTYKFIPHKSVLARKEVTLSIGNKKLNTKIDAKRKANCTLKISDLTMNTTHELLASNAVYLFEEAQQNPLKFSQLNNYLDMKLRSLTPNLKKIEKEQPDRLVSLLLLKAMLQKPQETMELLDKVRGNNKYGNFIVKKSHFNIQCFSSFKKAALWLFDDYKFVVQSIVHGSSVDKNNKVYLTPEKGLQRDFSNPTHIKNTCATAAEVLTKCNLNAILKSNVISKKEQQESAFSLETEQSEAFVKTIFAEANADYREGAHINRVAELEFKQILSVLGAENSRAQLLTEINKELQTSESAFHSIGDEIQAQLNAKPSTVKTHILKELGMTGKVKERLTLQHALVFFAKYNLSKAAHKTKLPENELNKLRSLTHTHLIEGSKRQQLMRSKSLIEDIGNLKRSDDMLSKNNLIYRLGKAMTQSRCFDPIKHPEILLFEYLDDKLIYPNQYKMLTNLFEKNEKHHYISKVIQLIMGGGKSKVLLPLLAKARPDGTNLTILEVPHELFETNLCDLQEVSERIFGQKIYPFLFHRNLECDSHYFHEQRDKLRHIIANKEYMLTTRKSMDSLMLKYIDLLNKPEENEEWKKQVKYLDEIIQIIKEQGDAIIDEIDLNLNPKDQLIYTVEEGKPVDNAILKSLIDLYEFTRHIPFNDGKPSNLYNIIIGKTSRPSERIQIDLVGLLTEQLVTSDKSPIHSILSKMHSKKRSDLMGYFKNNTKAIPDDVLKLPKSEQEIIALYKEQLTRLLKISLNKNRDEHYGLSTDQTKDHMEREIAIPFAGCNTPNENAKFQNHFLTINYTIQIQLSKPLSRFLFLRFLKDFSHQLGVEKSLNAYRENKQHTVNEAFQNIIKVLDLNLQDIDLEDVESINKLYESMKDNLSLKQHCLSQYVLPSILSNPETLSANTQNHVDMFRSTVGFTGTDYNFRTFHPSIVRDNSESFGTDGQIVDHLLRKKSQTHVLQKDGYCEIFDLINQHPKKQDLRTLIDAGAHFKGVANREVANVLAVMFNQSSWQAMDLKHILYFNQENELCALKVCQYPENEKPIVLGSSENIEQKLNCTSNQYFTYYDQKHTTGIDIKQVTNTLGLMTVSEHNTLRDLTQAAMRLRDLKGTHQVECVVMKSFAKAFPEIKTWNAKIIMNLALKMQAEVLMKAHISSGLQKIHNVFKSYLLKRIRKEKDIKAKSLLAKSLKPFLYDVDRSSIFDKFGTPEGNAKTQAYMTQYEVLQENKFAKVLEDAGIVTTKKLRDSLKIKTRKIIEQCVPICASEHKTPSDSGLDNQVTAQREAQNEREQEKEQEKDANNSTARNYQSWERVKISNDLVEGKISCIKLKSLNSLMLSTNKPQIWSFSDNILVSQNFYNASAQKTLNKFNTFKKPCFFNLVIQKNDSIKHILITGKEAKEIQMLLSTQPKSADTQIWIETPGGVPFYGKRAKNLHANFDSHVEQIQFFNADLTYLAGKSSNSTWLKGHCNEKFKFLEEEILINHPSKANLLPMLRKVFGKLLEENIQDKPNQKPNRNDPSWKRMEELYLGGATNDPHHQATLNVLDQYMNGMDPKRKAPPKSIVKPVPATVPLPAVKPMTRIQKIAYAVLATAVLSLCVWAYCYFQAIALKTVLALATVYAPYFFIAALVIPAIYALRYKAIQKLNVKHIKNETEYSALQAGVQSNTWEGYIKSFGYWQNYRHYATYCRGYKLTWESKNDALCEKIKKYKRVAF